MKNIFHTLFIIVILSGLINAQKIRAMKYPENADSLRTFIKTELNQYLVLVQDEKILGIVIPHYLPRSTKVTAIGVKQLEGRDFNRVIIISNSHRGNFDGISIDDNDYWETPFGKIPVDKSFSQKIVSENDLINFNPEPHETDHTIELILPYLQSAMPMDFQIVPILFGNSYYIGKDINENYKILADALLKHLDPKDIIIISSDMTHFYPDILQTIEFDNQQLKIIEKGNIEDFIKREIELAKKDDSERKIMNCAKDGIKTMLAVHHAFNGDNIKVLDYGLTGADWNNQKFCGFSSIIFTSSN